MTTASTPAPEPTKTTVARFKKFGAYSVCEICNLAMDYCRGHVLPEFGAEPETSLKQRIAEAKAGNA